MKAATSLALLPLLNYVQAYPSLLGTRGTDVADSGTAWRVYFWGGGSCTSPETGAFSGGGADTTCYKIPDYGVTDSLDYYAAQSRYRLHLYSNENCSGNEGSYEGVSGEAVCVEASTYRSFRVDESTTKRDALAASTGTEVSEVLDKRHEFNVNMLFGAAIASSTFAYMAADSCPKTATKGEGNTAKCAISATTSVFSGFFAVYQAAGLLAHKGPTTKRGTTSADLPFEDETILPGSRISMYYLGIAEEADGVGWHNYVISTHNIDRGHTANATARFHPSEDRQYIFASASDLSDYSEDDVALEKRSETPTAYYSWRSEDEYYYDNTPHDSSVVENIALSVWNHGHSNDISSFCASVETVQSTTRWNKGYFALVAGGFVDYSSDC